MNKSEIAEELTHCIQMYSHTDSKSDQEFLAKIFYYAGLLAGEVLSKND